MVDILGQIEKGVEFSEPANTPIPGEKVYIIDYLQILRTGGMEKSCEQWKEMQVDLKTWQAFKDHFFASLQALSDPQDVNSGGQCVKSPRQI